MVQTKRLAFELTASSSMNQHLMNYNEKQQS
ncbi:hypothetical protein LASUN_11290 [Lentilactobacillus sunkii]|jgi:hypothetical protein|uniref:Uncharacterized protein n=1 Tax=Lentilactobacillus sunkii TaxID=481719 RepID=A0A1E7XD65_9LACO|nr:hypothetical protein LASUN_11290 [Lentilactobacillus sunkii]